MIKTFIMLLLIVNNQYMIQDARRPNELGDIMVIMYHGVDSDRKGEYHISSRQFLDDLQYLKREKYIPISMNDFLNGNINIKKGYTPVVLTFDDGLPSQFSFEKENGKLVPVENTAVDIMNNFAEENPEFGKNAIFYINGSNDPFKGEGTFKQRIDYLLDNGYEVSNHTYNHENLSQISAKKIKSEIGKVDKMLKEARSDINLRSISLPFGIRPKKENEKYIKNGIYENNEYSYEYAFRAGPSAPLYPTYHKDYQKLNAPRLRGNNGEYGDMWYYIRYQYDNSDRKKYISDGFKNIITVPEEKKRNLNLEMIKNKIIVTYE